MEIVIGLFLAAVGVAIVWGFSVLGKTVRRGISNHSKVADTPCYDDIEVREGVGVDELVYLYAHEFTRPRASGAPALPRDRVWAPLSDDELDAEELTHQLLYATLCELHREGYISFRLTERQPTYLPPFPQKKWEMQLQRLKRLPVTPLCDAIGVGFDLTRKRLQAKMQFVDEQTLWVGLDELVERGLKAIRQELSFWERSGVHGDLRNYVASSLIASGYLIAPQRDTWLDKVRTKRPIPNRPAIEKLADEAKSLKRRVQTFRKMHGSEAAQVDDPHAKLQTNVDPSLADTDGPLDELPLDDCLRLSIYETLIAIKQLEPSSEPGV